MLYLEFFVFEPQAPPVPVLDDGNVMQRHHMCKCRHVLMFVTSKIQSTVMFVKLYNRKKSIFCLLRFITSKSKVICGQEK